MGRGQNELNQTIHDGISFELASRAFSDDFCLIYPDRIDEETGELRWHALGRVGGLAIYLVVQFTGARKWLRNRPHRLSPHG